MQLRQSVLTLSALLIGSALSTGALAAEPKKSTAKPVAPVAEPAPVATLNPYQNMAGSWMIRARAIGIVPDETSSIIGAPGEARFSNEVVPEVDFSYFFTNNIAAELILATAKHTAKDNLTAGGSVDVGSAWVLPPTLTLQYHFTDFTWGKPYVGAGVNYTMYYSEKAGAISEPDIHDSWGWALQAGVDVPVSDRWSWNFDVKKIYTGADATWNDGAINGDIDLDPWVIGTGIAYRF